MRHFAPDHVPQMSGATRDAMITRLHREGKSDAVIAHAVGLHPKSVRRALARIAEGREGRPPRV